MTIEAWNILLSAAILALLTGGGLWLKYVVDQQLKFKDTAIEALEGVVKLKDAHIATLEDNTAPAIVEAYAKMRQHANIMTDESQKLSAQLDALTKEQQATQEMLVPKILLGEANGLNRAYDLLAENVWTLLFPNGKTLDPKFSSDDFTVVINGLLTTAERISEEVQDRLGTGTELTRSLKP